MSTVKSFVYSRRHADERARTQNLPLPLLQAANARLVIASAFNQRLHVLVDSGHDCSDWFPVLIVRVAHVVNRLLRAAPRTNRD